jgi:hypothetical protein
MPVIAFCGGPRPGRAAADEVPYNKGMASSRLARLAGSVVLVGLAGTTVWAQVPVPRPFPKPGEPPAPQPPPQAAAAPVEGAPTEANLGLPVYPGADFIASYDAGFGQRYYLFGTNAPFSDIVNYYKNVLQKGGDVLFDEPPVHLFEIGRFREETMAFPPGVTVKDYTWGGSEGYLVVKGSVGTRYRTIIQIVPVTGG